MNKLICAGTRMGVLCGKCKEKNSVYYHSLGFECKRNSSCRLGWLFYILSEILPVTAIFIIIIFFNISFTSGIANGFIFYSQVVVMLRITAGGMIPFSPTLYNIIRFLYLGFSLDPISFPSACLKMQLLWMSWLLAMSLWCIPSFLL